MSGSTHHSSRPWFTVALVATAGFLFFTAGTLGLKFLAGDPAAMGATSTALRAAVSIVLAAALLVSERRRHYSSAGDAAMDGVQIAVIVIVVGNLTGTSYAGVQLAAQSALVLLGLPLMAALTHALSKRFGPST